MDIPKVFVKNKYGISIVKCCASCKHKQLDNRNRLCLAGEGTVPSSYLCSQWEMSGTLKEVGKGDGCVKTSEYLHFSLDRLFNDYTISVAAVHNGVLHERLSIDDVRKEFKEKYGDIFAIER